MSFNVANLYRLTTAQSSIWIAQSQDPASAAYNMGECVEIAGDINLDLLSRAIFQTVEEAQSLSLAFTDTDDGPRQFFAQNREWEIANFDFSTSSHPAQAAMDWMRGDMAKPLDISNGRPFRFALLQLSSRRLWFYAVNHHLVNDGFGWRLMLGRIAETNQGLVAHAETPVRPFRSVLDITANEKGYRASAQFSRDHDYWLELLQDRPKVSLASPGAQASEAVELESGYISRSIDLVEIGRRWGASAVAVFVAGAAAYVFRQTNATDIVVGLQVSARLGEGLRDAVGLATNILPVRIKLDAAWSFGDLVGVVGKKIREALRHQQYRAEDLIRELRIQPNDPELFNIVVNFIPLDESMTLGDRPIRRFPLGNWRVPDLQIAYYDGSFEEGRRIDIIANAGKYGAELVRLHSQRFCRFFGDCAASPEKRLAEIARMPEQERQQLLGFSRTESNIDDEDSLIHHQIERQARGAPDRIAIRFKGSDFSYQWLDQEANKLARHLRANGVGPDAIVAICMERSVEMVLAIVATLKAGGAYAPVDPNQPIERINFILRDTAARFVLTTPQTRNLASNVPANVVVLDISSEAFASSDGNDLDPTEGGLTANHLAYVIYTSGSTGLPKGVMVEHRALFNRLRWMQRAYHLDADDRVLQKTPFTFDVSVWEFLWPLSQGALLVMAAPGEHLDPESLARTIVQNSVTTVHFVPSMLALFLNDPASADCESLTRIVCSGEELPARLAADCIKMLPRAQLYNLYGPTEAAIDVTHWTCTSEDKQRRVPIGRPIDNIQIHILDAALEPVAIGAVGEIYLAGVGLARGYLNRPELTAEAFVPNPFADDPTARMYKTGDIGLWRPDGAIEYHGRNDNQVKIRGVRIELGEIEVQLRSMPNVSDAAVIVESRAKQEQGLVAFYVVDPRSEAAENPNFAATLKRQLSRRLPENMLPSVFIRMEALPLTDNGKLDRRTLSHLAVAAPAAPDTEAQALATPTEQALAEVWRELLGRDDFGRSDEFFDLGGHSLLATQMRSRIRSRLGVDIALKLVFERRTLMNLAVAVDEALVDLTNRERQRIEPAPVSETYVLSPSQQRMWLNQSLEPEGTAYNLVGAVKLTGALNVDALSRAFNELRSRHESLRTIFFDTPDGVRQRVLPFSPVPLEPLDLRSHGEAAAAEALRLAEEDARTPFVLATGPVLRILLFRIADREHALYVALHHISGDQWSFGVSSRELSSLYNAFCEGRAADLTPLPIQYRDYATWRRSEREVARGQTELAYWKRKLDGLPALDLPTDFPRPRLRTSTGAFVLVPIPMDLFSRLERLSRREGATLFMTMLAAFAAHLHRLTGQTDIAIGTPIANRTQSEVETLIGTFVNTLVMRLDLGGDPTFRDLLQRVRDVALEAYSHQDASFDELVHLIARPRDDGRPPLAQVMFNMLNAPFFSSQLDGLTWEQVAIDRGGAQFELSVSVEVQELNAIVFEYNADLFKRSSIERFAAQYLQLLYSFTSDRTTPISRGKLLPAAEAKLLLEDWNATDTARPFDLPFIRMFEDQATVRPDALALQFESEAISYRELNSRSEAVAAHLRARGVRPGVGVGVCLKRGPLLIAALLGVQKAGGHYIPLDPEAPRRRLEYMIDDSGLDVLIAEPEIGSALAVARQIAHLDPQALSSPPPEAESRVAADMDGLAYVIYTSGSTGQPKGVRVTQRGLSNFLCAVRRRPGMTEQDAIIGLTTVSFDISGLEFYLPLSVGARLVLAPREIATDGEGLAKLLDESGATVLQATPATWRMLLDAGWTGDHRLRALCGGEALSMDLARELLPRVAELWNLFGPTETTIWSTVARVDGEGEISIGAPIDNTRVYIVDGKGQICPIGIVGEIWIAGDGVAEGYQNKPELTGERFVCDPFVDRPGQRVYKTGDLGLRGDDGRLYHYGRMDNQLKVRGFRIEAEEVETLLRSHPAVDDAVVTARSGGEGDTRLVGYLIARSGRLPTSSELRAHVRESAPDYMTPSIFVELDKFPLTPSGKIDRKALPDPFASEAWSTKTREPPAPGAEQSLADIWGQVLKVETVGANDNFFELGGHSLLALRVAAQVKTKTGKRMDPRTMYFQTLRQIAAALGRADADGGKT